MYINPNYRSVYDQNCSKMIFFAGSESRFGPLFLKLTCNRGLKLLLDISSFRHSTEKPSYLRLLPEYPEKKFGKHKLMPTIIS